MMSRLRSQQRSNSLKNKYQCIDLQEQIIRNRQMSSKGFISKSILNSTVDILNQNFVLKDNLRLQRKKSIIEKDTLLMRCYDKNSQVLDAQKTLNIYKQHTNTLQNKAETIINELKAQIASLKLDCNHKNVQIQGLKLQMNREILKREQMLKYYENIIKKMSQDQMLKERNVLNQKKSNSVNKDERKNSNTLQNIQNTKGLLINQNQKLKHQIFKLQKTLSLHKKQVENQVQYQQSPQKITPIKSQKKDKKQQLQIKRNNVQTLVYQQSLSSMTIEKWQKLFYSLNNLRNGVNRQIFSIFIQSSRQADKKKRNGLSIFLQKWKQIQINRIIPFLNAYFQMSSSILQCLHNQKTSANEELLANIKEALPVNLCQSQPQKLAPELQIKSSQVYKTHMKLKQAQNKQTRSQINLWVLSTVQFTNNQHQIDDELSLKNNLLYLFRLLTIQFRIEYPPVGKQNQYILDKDVRNCLLHYILVAVKQVVSLI